MRPIKPNTRRKSLLRSVLLGLLAIALGGACTVGVLSATHVIDLGKLAFWRAKPKVATPIPPGWVAIPLNYKTIPAYTLVTRDYLMNPKSGEREKKWVPPADVVEGPVKGVVGIGPLTGVYFDVTKIIGRVTAREIPALHYLYETDLLPPGTRPGVSAGVPQGKRAYTFTTNSLDGCVYQLKQGDHVDLLVSVPVDMPGAGHSGAMGGTVLATPDTLLQPKRTLEIPLVQDGVVVSPVTVRTTQTTNSSVMNGATTRNVRVEEIVIAVAPKEVAPLDEAKALKHRLTCVARSGLPDTIPARAAPAPSVPQLARGSLPSGASTLVATPVKLHTDRALPDTPITNGALLESSKNNTSTPPGQGKPSQEKAGPGQNVNPAKSEAPPKDQVALDITPGFNPFAEIRYMEVMIGSTRKFVLFNGPGNSPVVAAESDGSAAPAAAAAPATATPATTATPNAPAGPVGDANPTE